MTVTPRLRSVGRRMNFFGCYYMYLCLMFTNCLCEHARTRACARACNRDRTRTV